MNTSQDQRVGRDTDPVDEEFWSRSALAARQGVEKSGPAPITVIALIVGLAVAAALIALLVL